MRFQVRITLVVIVALLLAGLLMAGVMALRNAGVEIVLINGGNTSIKDISIKFTGVMRHILELPAKTVYIVKINPEGESNLKIEFIDAEGKRHREIIDVYFERNYREKITIRVNSFCCSSTIGSAVTSFFA
jgi:hypothetical protein